MPPGQPTTEVSADPPPPTAPLSCQNVYNRFCGVPKVSLRVTPSLDTFTAVYVRLKARSADTPVNIRPLDNKVTELAHLLKFWKYPGLATAMRRRVILATDFAPLLTTDQLFSKMVQTG